MSESTESPAGGARFGCVILAAGLSARMGSPKQLLEIGGRPLVLRAAEAALESPVWPVVVVLGAHAERIRPLFARLPVLVVENPTWQEGMASSIRAGVAALHQFSRDLDGAVFTPCDQPAFSADTIRRLIAARAAAGRTMAAARYAGACGAPALFLAVHFPALGALTGETGARALLKADPGAVAAVDMPEMALDLDRPEDLTKIADCCDKSP